MRNFGVINSKKYIKITKSWQYSRLEILMIG
nr:MAG TPA: hypothetical protein [Caudoviricetes sp.]